MGRHGFEREARAAHAPAAVVAHLGVAGTDCERCPDLVGRALSLVGGVLVAVVSLDAETAVVTYDPRRTFPSRLLQAVAAAAHDGRHRFAAAVRSIGPPDNEGASRSAAREAPADTDAPGGPVAPTTRPPWERDGAAGIRRLMRDVEATPGRLTSLLCHVLESPHGRAVVASSYDLPPEMLAALAADSADEVCLAVAANPATPPAVLDQMASHWACRTALAGNPSAPAALLAGLATDWDPSVRSAVARNSGTPSDLLEQLSFDADTVVRAAVAANPATAVATLERLALDGAPSVVRAVARHPRCPAPLRRRPEADASDPP
jgi:copper chaperone CopZ